MKEIKLVEGHNADGGLYDGFMYSGGFWYSPDGKELCAADPDAGTIWADAIFLHNRKVTKETCQQGNRYKSTPKRWTQNTIRSACKLAKQTGILE